MQTWGNTRHSFGDGNRIVPLEPFCTVFRRKRHQSEKPWYILTMHEGNIGKDIARWVALGALFLIPCAPLVVVETFFFPFITGKAFYLRILIEIACVAWIALACIDKEYRPRFSWIGVAVVAFVAWMFVADLFAVNVLKAFWSNFERMEGWILLAHLIGFFFAASNVLRVEKKWHTWFMWSLVVSLYTVGYALLQLAGRLSIHQGSTRIDATLGNSAYLAIYLLFNVFIALWLALRENRVWLQWSLVILAAVEGTLIFFTETRGAILGLVGALSLAAFLTAVTGSRRVRGYAIVGLSLLLIAAGTMYAERDSSFVQNNRILQRIASISLADGQTRFTIWHMAFEGVAERPLVGWGQEGFNYVFNKYYEPSLYGQESWFDRAHNAFIDWLSAGGIPAFVLYLALFGTAIVLLWRRSELSRAERIMLTGALVGYAIHNFFVFDNLYSYIYFFALLALIDSQVGRTTVLEDVSEVTTADGMTYVLPVATVALVVVVWFVNVPGLRAVTQLITALSPSGTGISGNIAEYKDLLSHPAFVAQEIREQLVSFAGTVAQASSATDVEKRDIALLAVSEMQKQVEAYPADARGRLELAYAYRAAGDLQHARAETLAATELSPKKEEMWIESGAIAWDLGDTKAVQTDFTKAYELGPQFPTLAAYAAAGNIAVGDMSTANTILTKAYGTTTVDSTILGVAYYRTKNWPSLIRMWKLRTAAPGVTPQTWFSLAAVYYAAGDNASAIATINEIVKRFPEAAASGAAAIKQIQSGQ